VIFVVDASVVVKWFVDEPRHDLARELIDCGALLATPDLVILETANSVQKKVSCGQMDAEQARKAVATLGECFSDLIPFATLLPAALEMSLALRHPIYDCTYLACANMLGAQLVTDDEKFFKRCAAADRASSIVLLTDLRKVFIGAIEKAVQPFTQDLFKLYQAAENAWVNICSQLGVNPGGGNLSRQVAPMEIYADSIPQRRLSSLLERLPAAERAALLAIAWYGRGTNPDLAQGYRHALSGMGPDKATDVAYLAMQLQYIEIGLHRLREDTGASNSDGDLPPE